MKATLETQFGPKKIDFSLPMPIHLFMADQQSLGAWYAPPPRISPHVQDDFVGSIAQGAPINFNDITFNPHAHGTHTESVGHILEGDYQILRQMTQYFCEALLISVSPLSIKGDAVITEEIIAKALTDQQLPKALVIRTLPNTSKKKSINYSHTNPPYLSEAAAELIKTRGVQHLVVDLPSIDKEEDGGALLAHKAFWNVGSEIRSYATITEFAFVPTSILDGYYALQFGLAPFINDAAPSSLYLYSFENR